MTPLDKRDIVNFKLKIRGFQIELIDGKESLMTKLLRVVNLLTDYIMKLEYLNVCLMILGTTNNCLIY